MDLEEYKLFMQLAEVYEKASKAGHLRQVKVDQRLLELNGISQHYEWTLVAKKIPSKE